MSKYFGQGIPLSAAFDLGSPKPLDARTVVATLEELESMPAVQKYAGLTVYVEDEEKKYLWNGAEWVDEISTGTNGKDGSGIYVLSTALDTEVEYTTESFSPTGIKVGDHVVDSNGDFYRVTAIDSETNVVTLSEKIFSIKGADGNPGAKGEKGDPFTVAKTFASIQEMQDGFETDGIAEGSFVIISSDVEDEDNAKLYVKGATEYTFITDLSGATGIKGEAATIEIGTVTAGEAGTDPTVTNSGTSTNAVFDFVIPKGADGDQIKIGETYATAETGTIFFRTVSIVPDESGSDSGIDVAKIDEAPIEE